MLLKRDGLPTSTVSTMTAFVVGFLILAIAQAQQRIPTGTTLSAEDRAEIQQLVARYARALSACAAEEYASLFTPDGVFVSDDFRGAKHRELYGPGGRLQGREKLIELVLTEEHCLTDTSRSSSNVSRPAPARDPQRGGRVGVEDVAIESAPEGATGKAFFGSGGRYEDVYVKTPDGWRFKSRTVFMPPRTGSQPGQAAPSR